MRRIGFILAVFGIALTGRLLFTLSGSSLRHAESVNYVHFILPDGFTGVFRLVEDPLNGAAIVVEEKDESHVKIRMVVLEIPALGELHLKNLDFFERWHRIKAAYASGSEIPWADLHSDSGMSNNALYDLGRASDNTKCIDWYLVGTRDDYDTVRDDMTALSVGSVKAEK